METKNKIDGGMPVRLNDIAREANVSRIAVSKVLLNTGGGNVRVGEKTRRRILEVAGRFDYRPNMAARTLISRKSRLIGVIVDSQAPLIFYEYLKVIEREITARGYRCMIAQQHDDVDSIVEYAAAFASYGVEGMISMAHHYPDFGNDIIELMKYLNNHVVFVGKPDSPDCCYVESDVGHGVEAAVRHLAATGKKRIALCLVDQQSRGMKLRYRGYCAGLKACGLVADSSLVLIGERFRYPSADNAAYMVEKMVREAGADAIIACNDIHAVTLTRTLIDRGWRIPQDVSVIGCDDMDFTAYSRPSISSIRQDYRTVGKETVALLFNILENKPVAQKGIKVRPELMIRESSNMPNIT